MQVSSKTLKYVVLSFILLVAGIVFFVVSKKNTYEKNIRELQNELASKDQTLEVQKNVYAKLTLQFKDLKMLLDTSDSQIKSLEDELKKNKQKLLDVTTIALNWKNAYEAEVNAHQTEVPPVIPGEPARIKVEFEKDFGYIGVTGYTLTNPPTAWMRVQQNRPLNISVAIAQDKDKKWHTYATSSEDNVGINIKLTGVNPWILQPKWYEKIGVETSLGLDVDRSGVLAGIGLNYKLKQWTVGPNMWISVTDRVDKYYGASLTWRPFEK